MKCTALGWSNWDLHRMILCLLVARPTRAVNHVIFIKSIVIIVFRNMVKFISPSCSITELSLFPFFFDALYKCTCSPHAATGGLQEDTIVPDSTLCFGNFVSVCLCFFHRPTAIEQQ